MKNILLTASLSVLACMATAAQAEDLKGKVIISGLDNPTGVCVQPGTNHVFLAARDGVHRVDATAHKAFPEITGYPTDIYGKGPKYNIGPLGLAFLGKNQIVVGDGSHVDGQELVQVYTVGETPLEKPIASDKADTTLGPIKEGTDSAKGEGNFYGLAINKKAIFITSNGDDTKGWVLKSELTDGKPGELKPFLTTKVATNVDAPVAITISPKGYLVVGQMGEMNVAGDSLLTIYNPDSKELVHNYKTGLHDISGVAYSPTTGKLYVVDFAWTDVAQGGLFELEVKDGNIVAKKIAAVMKPTALAFDSKGQLFVTSMGVADKESAMTGELLMFDAGL